MGQPKLLRAPSLLAPVISSSAEGGGGGGGVGAEYTCGRRPLAPDRPLALPLSSTAHPCAPARPSALCSPARAAPRWRDFGCADVSGNPLLVLLSPSLRFPGPETDDGAPGRSPLSLFHRESRRGRRRGRCTYSVNTSPSLARMDGRRNSSLTVAPFNSSSLSLARSLSLSGVVMDGRTRTTDVDSALSIREASHVSGARAPRRFNGEDAHGEPTLLIYVRGSQVEFGN